MKLPKQQLYALIFSEGRYFCRGRKAVLGWQRQGPFAIHSTAAALCDTKGVFRVSPLASCSLAVDPFWDSLLGMLYLCRLWQFSAGAAGDPMSAYISRAGLDESFIYDLCSAFTSGKRAILLRTCSCSKQLSSRLYCVGEAVFSSEVCWQG